MPRFSQNEIEDLSRLLAADEISAALRLYQTQYPPTGDKVFQDPDRELIEDLLATRPATLAYLHPAELRELQVVAAMTLLVGHRTRPDKLLRPGQKWSYPISLLAAVNAVISNYNWTRDRNRLRQWRLKRVWQYLRTCDPGTCAACDDAGRYLYSDDDFPGSPIPGCSNIKNGCRCLAVNLDPKDGQALIESGKLRMYTTAP